MDLEEDEDIVVGAMATDENDWILITGDSIGNIKVRKDWNSPAFGHPCAACGPGLPPAPIGSWFHGRRW